MRVRVRYAVLSMLMSVAIGSSAAWSANIMFVVGNLGALSAGDVEQKSWFEDRGDTIDLWDNATIGADRAGALAAADASDLVYTSESISSGRFRQIEATTTPIIFSDGNACDILGVVPEGSSDFQDGHGSPTALKPNGKEITAGTSFGTTLEIVNADHPIAQRAGLAAGSHIIYNDLGLGTDGGGRRSWCSTIALDPASVDVVASLPEYKDDYPFTAAMFVIEKDAALVPSNVENSSTGSNLPLPNVPGMRIFTFLSDTNRGPEIDPFLEGSLSAGEADGTGPGWESTLLTPAGKSLILAAIDYALGVPANPCDLNGDGAVDAADAGIMFGDWGGPGSTSPADKNQDGFVDAADAGIMFEDWTGDPIAPGPRTATAEYNAETGELKISSAGAVNVFVQSASSQLVPISPAPSVPVGLLTNNSSRVGITNLGPIEVTNFSFGNIGKGLAMSDLKLVYTSALGTKGIEVAASGEASAAFKYIPEPTSWTLVVLGLAARLAVRRR